MGEMIPETAEVRQGGKEVPTAGVARAPSCWGLPGHSKGPRPGHLYQGEGSGAFIRQPHQELVRSPRKYASCTFPPGPGRREPDLPLQACCPERAQEGPCRAHRPPPPTQDSQEVASPGTWVVRAGLAPSTGRWIQPPLPDR